MENKVKRGLGVYPRADHPFFREWWDFVGKVGPFGSLTDQDFQYARATTSAGGGSKASFNYDPPLKVGEKSKDDLRRREVATDVRIDYMTSHSKSVMGPILCSDLGRVMVPDMLSHSGTATHPIGTASRIDIAKDPRWIYLIIIAAVLAEAIFYRQFLRYVKANKPIEVHFANRTMKNPYVDTKWLREIMMPIHELMNEGSLILEIDYEKYDWTCGPAMAIYALAITYLGMQSGEIHEPNYKAFCDYARNIYCGHNPSAPRDFMKPDELFAPEANGVDKPSYFSAFQGGFYNISDPGGACVTFNHSQLLSGSLTTSIVGTAINHCMNTVLQRMFNKGLKYIRAFIKSYCICEWNEKCPMHVSAETESLGDEMELCRVISWLNAGDDVVLHVLAPDRFSYRTSRYVAAFTEYVKLIFMTAGFTIKSDPSSNPAMLQRRVSEFGVSSRAATDASAEAKKRNAKAQFETLIEAVTKGRSYDAAIRLGAIYLGASTSAESSIYGNEVESVTILKCTKDGDKFMRTQTHVICPFVSSCLTQMVRFVDWYGPIYVTPHVDDTLVTKLSMFSPKSTMKYPGVVPLKVTDFCAKYARVKDQELMRTERLDHFEIDQEFRPAASLQRALGMGILAQMQVEGDQNSKKLLGNMERTYNFTEADDARVSYNVVPGSNVQCHFLKDHHWSISVSDPLVNEVTTGVYRVEYIVTSKSTAGEADAILPYNHTPFCGISTVLQTALGITGHTLKKGVDSESIPFLNTSRFPCESSREVLALFDKACKRHPDVPPSRVCAEMGIKDMGELLNVRTALQAESILDPKGVAGGWKFQVSAATAGLVNFFGGIPPITKRADSDLILKRALLEAYHRFVFFMITNTIVAQRAPSNVDRFGGSHKGPARWSVLSLIHI